MERLRGRLAALAGNYLRTPHRGTGVTCADCMTPVAGYELCYVCNGHRRIEGHANYLGFLTYAVAGQESGSLMRGYKASRAFTEHRLAVGLLLFIALHEHSECVGILAGIPVTGWATVPSLPAKPGRHPLRTLVVGHAPGTEITLVAAATVKDPRCVDADHFACQTPVPPGSHIMLIDDTWATGGHVQSAALALRTAGAGVVSALIVARWVKEEYAGSTRFIADIARETFDPRICPWTGGGCPSR